MRNIEFRYFPLSSIRVCVYAMHICHLAPNID